MGFQPFKLSNPYIIKILTCSSFYCWQSCRIYHRLLHAVFWFNSLEWHYPYYKNLKQWFLR